MYTAESAPCAWRTTVVNPNDKIIRNLSTERRSTQERKMSIASPTIEWVARNSPNVYNNLRRNSFSWDESNDPTDVVASDELQDRRFSGVLHVISSKPRDLSIIGISSCITENQSSVLQKKMGKVYNYCKEYLQEKELKRKQKIHTDKDTNDKVVHPNKVSQMTISKAKHLQHDEQQRKLKESKKEPATNSKMDKPVHIKEKQSSGRIKSKKSVGVPSTHNKKHREPFTQRFKHTFYRLTCKTFCFITTILVAICIAIVTS